MKKCAVCQKDIPPTKSCCSRPCAIQKWKKEHAIHPGTTSVRKDAYLNRILDIHGHR